ncbi:hypothetical protein ACJX0J_026759, partial [Zea mays]
STVTIGYIRCLILVSIFMIVGHKFGLGWYIGTLYLESNAVNAGEKKNKNPNRLAVELQSFCNEYLEFFNKEHISAPHDAILEVGVLWLGIIKGKFLILSCFNDLIWMYNFSYVVNEIF